MINQAKIRKIGILNVPVNRATQNPAVTNRLAIAKIDDRVATDTTTVTIATIAMTTETTVTRTVAEKTIGEVLITVISKVIDMIVIKNGMIAKKIDMTIRQNHVQKKVASLPRIGEQIKVFLKVKRKKTRKQRRTLK